MYSRKIEGKAATIFHRLLFQLLFFRVLSIKLVELVAFLWQTPSNRYVVITDFLPLLNVA
jgi:hypothetical protein